MLVPTAMILAAGHGTRLRPLTDELPKPLVPVGDRPMLAHIVDRLARSGVGRVVVNTHHKNDEFLRYIEGLGIDIQLIQEPEILGTAGGVAGARRLFGPGAVLVWNGDILANVRAESLLLRASEAGVVLAVAPRVRGRGTIGLDADGFVARLRGETFNDEAQGGDYMGVSAFGEAELCDLPSRGCLVADYLLPRLRRGARVATLVESSPFTDVGSLPEYLSANLSWLGERGGSGGSWVHASACVAESVTLRGSVVGAGARVEGEGSLEQCVVWPGARARAPLTRAVVTTAGRVVPVPELAGAGR